MWRESGPVSGGSELVREAKFMPALTRRDALPFHQATGLVSVFLILLLTTTASAAGAPDAEVLPPGVPARQAPAPMAPVVEILPAGAGVEILLIQSGPGGSWAQVVLASGQTGFVPSTNLRRLTTAPQWRSASPPSNSTSISRQAGESVLDIRLRRAGGVFLVTARLNNQITTNFVVDTGASVVMISDALADQLGLDHVNRPKRKTLTASGVLESPRVVLDSIHVPDENGAGVAEVEAHVATLPGAPPSIGGLLGQSFLRNFHVTIDAERGVMHLRPVRP
ncbi:MAG: aspartyl protease-like protein [Acidobacteria bacterium]|nr:aspartyl protease-like protein [Acidobacteriota bacterium]